MVGKVHGGMPSEKKKTQERCKLRVQKSELSFKGYHYYMYLEQLHNMAHQIYYIIKQIHLKTKF